MNNRTKNAIYSLVLVALVFVVWKFRESNSMSQIGISGETMGTTYHITYFDQDARNLKHQIDSLLQVFNKSLNTYLIDSEITEFNNGSMFKFQLPFFLPVLEHSDVVFNLSDGAFDPTVMPLVNAWGFGPGKRLKLDTLQIDSIMQFVGFEKIKYNRDSIWKEDNRVQLDFSAIAKGYGVDIVSQFIQSKGISNLFVEIGGEVHAVGENLKLKQPWEVGILDPNSSYDNQTFKAYAKLQDKAMATSGNYFNYYEEDGVKYSHTISPASGYTIRHNLLSATVFANDCMTADAWATALMVLGEKKSIEKLNKYKDIEALLIYSTEDGMKTFVTPGIKSFIKVNP